MAPSEYQFLIEQLRYKMKQKLVVIGNGMAGMKTVEELLNIEAHRYDITVFGNEPYGNYNRIMLPPLLQGSKTISDIMIHNFDWYDKNEITLHCGANKTIVQIDRHKKQVIAKDGTVALYDRLLIATGSLSTTPDIPGIKLEGVMGFREIADVEKLLSAVKTPQKVTIIGGGLLGLEAASALQNRAMEVTVINRSAFILNRQLDVHSSNLLKEHLNKQGVAFELSANVVEIIGADHKVKSIRLDNGNVIDTNFVIIAMGIRPNIELAKEAGIHTNQGVVVNDFMQTSDEAIYAVGECIEHNGELFGLVAPAYEQAKVCAKQLIGQQHVVFERRISATILKVTGIDLFSVGNIETDTDCQEQLFVDNQLDIYRKLIIKNQKLIGAILYGDTEHSHFYMKLISDNVLITPFRNQLLFNPPEIA